MAASAGIAKRATIGVGANFDQESINKFEKSLRDIHRTDESLTDSFNRTNQALDRFNEHLSVFSQHHDEIMDRLRESDDKAVESDRRVSQRYHDTAAVHNHETQQYAEDVRKQNEAALQRADNEVLNDRKQIEAMTHVMDRLRQNNTGMIRDNQHLKDRLDSVGTASEHVGNRIVSSNGRVSRSFNTSRHAVDRHMQSIRDAQGRDYRWLRTAQDMSGATLGLGAAFYKGAKDATNLQQAYIHAGNMAHYGGEKMSQVQHDINSQWRVGSQLAIKYGVSQDQIANGYKALVARGYTTNEALHTQKSLLQAAIASGDSYNDVVQGTTNVLDAYNLRSNSAATMTNNTKKVTDEMAYSADQTASNFRDLSTGMAYVAATAHTTNQPISETSSALGILSNKGMQASMAGVGLRKVLNSFLSINKKGQQAQVMQQLGLNQNSFRTASGHLKSLGQLMGILNEKTKNMGSAERGAVFHRFFGATGQEAALNLASDTKGLAQLNKQVEKSQTMGSKQQGYVALLSQHNMKSAQNQLHKFEQAWQSFTITSAREILPTLTHALRHVDVYLAKLNDLSPRTKKWTIFGALAVAAIAPISYSIFGIQSAFHGVEITLLHVRRLFSKPMPSGMTKSALSNANKQEDAALKDNVSTGRRSYIDNLGQYELDHPHLTKIRLARQRLGARTWSLNKGAMNKIANIGGDYKFESSLGDAAVPSMLARLNPFNKSARLFTHAHTSWLPFVHKLPAVTGHSAAYALRGTGTSFLRRIGGSVLSKAAPIATIASFVPDAYKAFTTKNKTTKFTRWGGLAGTAIGTGIGTVIAGPVGSMVGGVVGNFAGKISGRLLHTFSRSKLGHKLGRIFMPYGRAIVKGLHGPMKSVMNSWKYIKNGALAALKPIEKEWRRLFNGETKDGRQNLKAVTAIVHGLGMTFAFLFKIVAKTLGEIIKLSGYAIAGFMKLSHGIIMALGIVVRFFGSIPKYAGEAWDWTKRKWSGIRSWASDTGHGIAEGFSHGWDELKSGAHDALEYIESKLDEVKSAFDDVMSDVRHPISAAKSFIHSHAIGGAIEHNELSLVNENGPESAYNPRTNTFRMLGNNGPQVLELHAGEHVLDAQDTKKILTEGLGRGITLPGYANGTDSLKNLNKEHGTQVVSKTQQNVADKISGFRSKVSSAGKSANAIKKIMGAGKNWDVGLNGVGKGIMHSNDAFDLADAGIDLLGKGRMSNKLGHAGLDLGNAAGAAAIGTAIGGPVGTLVGAGVGLGAPLLEKKLGITGHSVAKKTHDVLHDIGHPIKSLKHGWHIAKQLGRNIGSGIHHFGHNIARRAGQAWRGTKRLGRNALRGIRSFGGRTLRGAKRFGSKAWRGIKGFGRGTMRFGKRLFRSTGRGIRRFGRGTMRFGRRMLRRGRSILRRASRGIARFSRRTWSNAKHLGRRLWSGTKRVASRMWSTTKRTAGRMWRSAKRTGRNIWNNTKRIARSIGHTAHLLWNRTKSGASRTWEHVISGARRMARFVGSRVRSMVSSAKSKARSAWSSIKSGISSAVSVVRSKVSSMVSWVISKAHEAMSVLSHIHIPHFATGGPIRRTTMALVGENGPETAYNPHSGTVRMLGLNGPQITELIAGEEVLTHTQTNRLLHGGLGRGSHLPAYAHGTNARLSGPASKSSSYSIIGTFSGEKALKHMSEFSKSAKTIWDDVSAYISDSTKTMSADVTKTNSDLSDTVKSIFKEMKKKVEGLSGDLRDGLVQAAEDTASGFGDKFKSLITYAKDDMEDVIDKLNKGVRGIDVALKAFGGNSHVIHPIHYATGTLNGRIAYPQLGILNDAISGPRQEAILRGNSILFPQGNDVRVPLQKGDAVLNGDQTKELINNTTVNHYAKGSGLHINFKHLGQLVKTIGLALKGPAAFFKKTFNHLVGSPSGHQLTKGMEESGIEAVKPLGVKWTRAMFKYIQSLLTPDGSGSASASAFLNYAERHRPTNYIFGGAPGLNDTDCSGFVEACLRHFGISAPRTSGAQIAHFQHITRSEARPGDLLGTGDHIGIVVDNGAHHYFSNHGPNGAHPAAGTDAYVPSAFPGGAASFARVPQLSKFNKPKHKNHTPFLEHLVASELGASATHWLKALAPMLSNSSGGGAGLASGNGVIATVWNEFAKLGMSPTQIEGALGGAKQESGFSPTAHDPDGGLGLFQATPPYGNLRAYAAEHHEDWKNPAVQAKQYFEHWLKPGGYLSTHGDVSHEAYEAASIEAHSHVDSGLAPDSDFGVRLAGAHEIQRWYESHQHANGGWASSPAIFGEAGPEVAINPARDTADHLIIEAINARIHHSTNSPIAGLIKSMNIKRNSHKLFNNIQSALSGNFNKSVNDRHNTSQQPVQINVKTNITIQGNPGATQYNQIKQHIAKAIQQGVQKEALKARNALSW